MENILLKSVLYLTKSFELKKGSIFIKDGIIKKVYEENQNLETLLSGESFKIIEGDNLLCLPGFINAHIHPSKDLYKGCFLGGDLPNILSTIHEQNQKESESDQYDASLYCIKRMLQMGVTTLGVFTSRYRADLSALKDSKMRGLLTYIVNESWHGEGVSPETIDFSTLSDEIENFLSNNHESLINFAIGTASEVTASKNFIKEIHRIAKEREVFFSLHAAEGFTQWTKSKEIHGQSSIEMLDSIGVIDDNTILVHTSYLSEKEISILKEHSVGLIYCPIANAFSKSSVFNYKMLRNGNCKFGMGTDSAMINPTNNLLEDTAFAYLSQRLVNTDEDVGIKELFKMITYGGAEVLGFKNLGAIEQDWIADLALFTLPTNLNVENTNSFNIIREIVSSNLAKYVLINGLLIIEDGEFNTLDEQNVNEKFSRLQLEVLPQFNDLIRKKENVYEK